MGERKTESLFKFLNNDSKMEEQTIEIKVERLLTFERHEEVLQDILNIIFDNVTLNYSEDGLSFHNYEKLLDYLNIKYTTLYNKKMEELKKEKEEKRKEKQQKHNEKIVAVEVEAKQTEE